GHRSPRHEGKPRAPFARSVVVHRCRCGSRRRGSGAGVRARAEPSRPAASSRAAPHAHADSHAQALGDAYFSELSLRHGSGMQTPASTLAPPAVRKIELMLNAARGHPTQSKPRLIATHSASLRAFTPVFDGLWTR